MIDPNIKESDARGAVCRVIVSCIAKNAGISSFHISAETGFPLKTVRTALYILLHLDAQKQIRRAYSGSRYWVNRPTKRRS